MTAEDLFVPTHRRLAFPVTPAGLPDFSADPGLPLKAGLMNLAPMLGAARGALESVRDVLHHRRPPYSGHENLAASAEARAMFAEATLLVDGAHRRAFQVADTLDGPAPDAPLTVLDAAALRMEMVRAGRECRAAVENLLDLHGSSSFARSNPLQRFWRDLAVGTRHAKFSSYLSLETYGRALADVSAGR